MSAISWNSTALSKSLNLVSGSNIAGITQSIYLSISLNFEWIFLDSLNAIYFSANPKV